MATAKPRVKTIDKRICHGGQDVDYVEVLQAGDHKLRVKIRSDAYAFQSYARVERWDGEKWQFLHGLGSSNMRTPTGLYTVHRAVDGHLETKFRKDRDELVRLAEAILS